MINNVIFSLNETLADSAGDYIKAINTMRRKRDYPPFEDAKILPWINKDVRSLINATVPIPLPPSNQDEAIIEFLQIFESQKSEGAKLFSGIPDLLDKLDEKGIAWSATTKLNKAIYQDIASRTGVGKDKITFYYELTTKGGELMRKIEENAGSTLFVGCSEASLMLAKAAGMKTCLGMWGYIADGQDFTQWPYDMMAIDPMDIFNDEAMIA